MAIQFFGYEWQKTIWKILRNPAFEVIAAIVVVMFATWLIVQTEAEMRHQTPFPVPTAAR